MPKVGDIVRAKDIGQAGRGLVYWRECPVCGKGRWKRQKDNNRESGRCVSCATKSRPLIHKYNKNGEFVIVGINAKSASELGYAGRELMYKNACPTCGVEVWRTWQQLGMDCKECANLKLRERSKRQIGEAHPRWQGGRQIWKSGYVVLTLQPSHPFFAMTDTNHRVLEHRLVVAQSLGRYLETWEVVHHKNGNKQDNHLENLELLPHNAENVSAWQVTKRITALESEVAELKRQVKLLKWQNKELRQENPELNLGNEPNKCVEARRFAPDNG